MSEDKTTRLHAIVHGDVQGVNFRTTTQREAANLNLSGLGPQPLGWHGRNRCRRDFARRWKYSRRICSAGRQRPMSKVSM